jgi:basic amino acid/polyamine antiporter, APA family
LGLKRRLGFWGVFSIAAGAMISSGLFVLPGLAFSMAGPAVVLSYAFAGILVIPAMMSKAELATAMPRSGGSYFFVERSMGALPGTLAGLANWLSIALKSAFALIGIGAIFQLIWPGADEWVIKAIAVAFCLLFTALNILSVKGVARLQILMVAGLLVILGLFCVSGLPATRHDHFAGFMDAGLLSVVATSGIVFVSFGGLTKVASVAEEVQNPGRNLPAGMFAAVLVVMLLYVGCVFVTVGVLDKETLAGSYAPLSLAAGEFLGKPGMILLSIGAMLAFVTTANGGILAASRSPLGMSRDGLLPSAVQNLSRRFGTPHVSILLTSAFIIAVIIGLSIPDLVKGASAMMLVLFVMVNLAVLIMRGSKLQNYRPLYRAPLYPWLQLVGIAVYVFLIVQMGTVPLLITGAFLLLGVLWYVIYVRVRGERESALVYIVRSVVSREIYRSELEEELKQIALERDEVTRDRFDRLISKCAILDLPTSIQSDEMFRRASAALAPRLEIDPERLFELFQQREAQSSTVLQPGLAIPHIIIDGEKMFDILLIRCREGVFFPGRNEPVQVAFVLVGTRDERNYHLRALMSIAHIVQEQDFVTRWLAAPEAENLRDIVLLSTRKRAAPGE